VITIIQESLITFRRNTDHDHPGIAITIVRESLITIPRNPQSLGIEILEAASPERSHLLEFSDVLKLFTLRLVRYRKG